MIIPVRSQLSIPSQCALIGGLVLALSLAAAGCARAPMAETPRSAEIERSYVSKTDRTHSTHPLLAPSANLPPFPEPRDTWFDFQNLSPVEFLDRVALSGPADSITPFGPVRTFEEIHRGWIQKSDLPLLLDRFEDTTPTVKIILTSCSFIPSGSWTTGELAAYLIQGYRAELRRTGYGGFPPALSSDFASPKEEVRAWAEAHLAE